jgi:hypothetical protein
LEFICEALSPALERSKANPPLAKTGELGVNRIRTLCYLACLKRL